MPSAAQWLKRVEEWKKSGQSATAFAETKGWNPGTFKWWASRIAQGRVATPATQVRLVPLLPVESRAEAETPPSGESGVEIHGPRGFVIHVKRGFESSCLRQVIGVLESR